LVTRNNLIILIRQETIFGNTCPIFQSAVPGYYGLLFQHLGSDWIGSNGPGVGVWGSDSELESLCL